MYHRYHVTGMRLITPGGNTIRFAKKSGLTNRVIGDDGCPNQLPLLV